MKMKKNLSGYALAASAVFSLIGLIFYIVTSVSGYLANTSVNPLPILFSILAIVIACGGFLLGGKLEDWINTVILVATTILIVVSFIVFVNARVDVIADVFFIPVNYPAAEGVTANSSIVGAVFYLLSIIALAVSGFASDKIR